ncbi:hypothetical protein LCGC14_2835160 [marine sediment metagenome]|uniref:Lipoprotein n=1 Tax=marine sediment metagenome TaxID=412755 RepID=A0A0F9B3X1_9ZZZZ
MKTHERTHQTMLLAAKVIALLGLLLAAAGCAAPTDRALPELTHPNEVFMQEAINCAVHALGTRELGLRFWENREWFTLADGRLGFVACRAGPSSTAVKCDHRYVLEAKHLDLRETAAHEVCHVSGDYNEPPLECMGPVLEECKP